MPTKQQNEEKTEPQKEVHQQREAVLGGQVMYALGRPVPLYRVEVRRLWEEHYRVNVFVGVDAASVRVAHSYFLVTDRDGNILACTPEITRQYERTAD
jgi:hypothetical protein